MGRNRKKSGVGEVRASTYTIGADVPMRTDVYDQVADAIKSQDARVIFDTVDNQLGDRGVDLNPAFIQWRRESSDMTQGTAPNAATGNPLRFTISRNIADIALKYARFIDQYDSLVDAIASERDPDAQKKLQVALYRHILTNPI
jgi:hypothetical protein